MIIFDLKVTLNVRRTPNIDRQTVQNKHVPKIIFVLKVILNVQKNLSIGQGNVQNRNVPKIIFVLKVTSKGPHLPK
jgi:hypothetical protein